MPKATICIDAGVPEGKLVDAWLKKWRSRLTYLSDNEGCGCCVDLYRVDAPEESLREFPPSVFAQSDWSEGRPGGPEP